MERSPSVSGDGVSQDPHLVALLSALFKVLSGAAHDARGFTLTLKIQDAVVVGVEVQAGRVRRRSTVGPIDRLLADVVRSTRPPEGAAPLRQGRIKYSVVDGTIVRIEFTNIHKGGGPRRKSA